MAVSPVRPVRSSVRARFRGLYGIAGPVGGASPEARRAETVALAEALIAGGVPVIQLRDKVSDGRALLETARLLRSRTREAGVLLILNDRLDVALLAEADGVHVGQDDLSVEDVRAVTGKLGRADLIVGLSTHDLDQVRAAAAVDVDYLGFGPVFATTSKSDALSPRGLPLLGEAVGLVPQLPVVAIGGVSLASASAVATTGAAMAAVIGDVVQAADRVQRVRELHAVLSRGR